MQEQELFKTYEVKTWEFGPRFYKILAASAMVNILALLLVGQTNLLTQKGCDSPLVEKVCQVLDTVYVGSSILTTNSEYIDDDGYVKTELADADITWIDQTGVEKFKYPDGYRALANPELMQPTEIPNADGNFPANIPGIPNPMIGGGNLMNEPQVLPPANDKAVTNLPDSPFSFGGSNPTIKQPKIRQPKPYKFPKVNTIDPTRNNPTLSDKSPNNLDFGDKTAKKEDKPKETPDKIEPKPTPTTTPNGDDVAKEDNYGIYKRKKPLTDFADKAKTDVKDVKLDAPFSVTIAADLDLGKDGKTTVLKNPKLVKDKKQTAGDEQMAKLAQEAILAIGDSGWLGYLKTLGIKKVVFTLSQDDNFMSAKILGEQKDDNAAKSSASGLNVILTGAKMATDGDEKALLEGAKTSSDGKFLVLDVAIPKQIALEMINRKLKEPKQDKTGKPEVKKQSTAQITESNKNTVK